MSKIRALSSRRFKRESDSVNLHRPTACGSTPRAAAGTRACHQGLTLVQFSAQRKRFLWDMGCMWGLLRGCWGDITGYLGLLSVYFGSGRSQVERKG